ncbi:MAG TPA: hypothetical protein VEH04_19040 [Verrucomicrobiae bacterium]|nr:hypothetical protein [Verrucomicrobiae bacterium]
MNSRVRFWLNAAAVAALLFPPCARAKDVLELQSHAAEDGWFHYRLRTLEDPFFNGIHIAGIGPWFTNYITSIVPEGWTNGFYNGTWNGIAYDGWAPQPRLNEISFSVQSGQHHFREGMVTLIIGLTSFDPMFSGGGYINLKALVPCRPEDASGGEQEMVTRAELVPDVVVDELIVTNGLVYGITFSWNGESTVQMEGSHDFVAWIPIARIHGYAPQTTWRTNVALNGFGSFFRLSLLSARHLPGLASQAGKGTRAGPTIPLQQQRIAGSKLLVMFISEPGKSYVIEQSEFGGEIFSRARVDASEAVTEVPLEIVHDRPSVKIHVRELTEK